MTILDSGKWISLFIFTELEENFKLYDKDENGRLSVKEAGTMWRSLGANPREAEIQEMFDAIDADGRFNIELQFIIISEYW